MLSSAGHPPALIVDPEGGVIEAPAPGPLLGAFGDAEWTQEAVRVAPGGLALLYTDGVTETAGIHERFGLERLKTLLGEHAGADPDTLLAALDHALAAFREGEPRDDVAALALCPLPFPADAADAQPASGPTVRGGGRRSPRAGARRRDRAQPRPRR